MKEDFKIMLLNFIIIVIIIVSTILLISCDTKGQQPIEPEVNLDKIYEPIVYVNEIQYLIVEENGQYKYYDVVEADAPDDFTLILKVVEGND